ncbi:MAG TPA: hypothetical protein VHA13_02370, partial [Gammaproteobacteria bacterium]|nr:hypothetical protein [Gammaproteobacteria bacterium]
KFHFDIHHLWNMDDFAAVITKQIELGHRVLPETLKAYDEWLSHKKEVTLPYGRGKIAVAPTDQYIELRNQVAELEIKKEVTNSEESPKLRPK